MIQNVWVPACPVQCRWQVFSDSTVGLGKIPWNCLATKELPCFFSWKALQDLSKNTQPLGWDSVCLTYGWDLTCLSLPKFSQKCLSPADSQGATQHIYFPGQSQFIIKLDWSFPLQLSMEPPCPWHCWDSGSVSAGGLKHAFFPCTNYSGDVWDAVHAEYSPGLLSSGRTVTWKWAVSLILLQMDLVVGLAMGNGLNTGDSSLFLRQL